MPKYNIYRIEKSKEQSLIEKFELVGLIKTAEKEIDGFLEQFEESSNPYLLTRDELKRIENSPYIENQRKK